MSNPNKRAGSQWEIALVDYFRENGFLSEKTPPRGTKDEGDLIVIDGGMTIVIEAKAEKRIDLPGYWRELTVEHQNYCEARRLDPATVGKLVIVKRRMHGVGSAYCVETVDEHFGIKS